MRKLNCDSDIGAVLIGNNDWTFAVPNEGGDGTTRVRIYNSDKEYQEDADWTKNLKYISTVQGTFNIYQYDCAFTELLQGDPLRKYIRATLSGRYHVYKGLWRVAFVKCEELRNGHLIRVNP